ncbi:MAG: 2Fe-2S iron-sulfur cluster-binding protein [Myxococcota bacterium]
MKALRFAQSGQTVEVHTNDQVLQALLAENVPVKMACGGRGLCASCHVFVEKNAGSLTPKTKREQRTLSLIGEATAQSRLACQAKVVQDGVVVRLPEGLYVQNTADLEELIGRRAESRLLHPIDGRVLVPAGKIITRSTVNRLQSVEMDVARVLSETRDA